MFSDSSNNDLVFIPVKRINIPGNKLTFGIREKKEEEFEVTFGAVNVISLIGDEEMSVLILSLVLARTTVLNSGSKVKKNVKIVHPTTFSHLGTIQKYFAYFMGIYGSEESSNVSWHPVSRVHEIASIVNGLEEGDVFIDLYSEAFLDTPRSSNLYMDCLNGNKNGRFILTIRFSRKKIVITKRCDNELVVESRKSRSSISLDPNNLNLYMLSYNPIVGTFRINGKDGRRIEYPVFYPFYIKER